MNIVMKFQKIHYVLRFKNKMENQKKFNLDKYLMFAGIAGPLILYLSLFIFGLMFPGYDFRFNYISELGALDSPVQVLTNVIGFSLVGILIMIFSYGLYRKEELGRLARFGALFIFISGLLLFFVGIFMCDPGCKNFSKLSTLHEIVANYQFPIMAIGFILFAFGVYSDQRIKYLTPIILFLGVITLILAYYSLISHVPIKYPGLLQRAAIGLPHFIIMLIAYNLYKNL